MAMEPPSKEERDCTIGLLKVRGESGGRRDELMLGDAETTWLEKAKSVA